MNKKYAIKLECDKGTFYRSGRNDRIAWESDIERTKVYSFEEANYAIGPTKAHMLNFTMFNNDWFKIEYGVITIVEIEIIIRELTPEPF